MQDLRWNEPRFSLYCALPIGAGSALRFVVPPLVVMAILGWLVVGHLAIAPILSVLSYVGGAIVIGLAITLLPVRIVVSEDKIVRRSCLSKKEWHYSSIESFTPTTLQIGRKVFRAVRLSLKDDDPVDIFIASSMSFDVLVERLELKIKKRAD